MTWIQTYTGRQFFPLEPRPEDVCVEDIAHALSNLCRFTGHCREFYSVAQHSVFVATAVSDLGPEMRRWGLMHDAAEAYLHDLPSPVKRSIPEYISAEARLLRVIGEALGLAPSAPPPEVRRADLLALSTEKRDLMGESPAPWTALPPPSWFRIHPLPPEKAKRQFLSAWEEATA